jgi:hypothetical protein
MRDQLTAKAPQTPFSKPQILSSFGVFGALAVPYLDTHARLLTAFCVLALTLTVSCDPEVKHVPPTQTVIRIEADPSVQAALRSLRVRTSSPEGELWTQRSDNRFWRDDLRWPVDIVVVPSSESRASRLFEVIVDALDGEGAVLVQARALTGFVLREQRVLVLTLSGCGTNPLGFVCEQDSSCLGPTCTTCAGARCTETPLANPAELTTLSSPAGPDAGTGGNATIIDPVEFEDASNTLAEPDAAGPELDSGVEPGNVMPPGCAAGAMQSDASACLDIDECLQSLDDCDREPRACVNLGNGLGFSCACPIGYRGDGRGENGCVDIDECAEQTDSCGALAMCNNTPGSYGCGDCPSGSAPGAGGACQDIDECTSNNGGCSPTATCRNQIGAANTCECPAGYTGNGVGSSGCNDQNECLTNNGGCSPVATCRNRPGAPNTCECPDGQTGNGVGANGCSVPLVTCGWKSAEACGSYMSAAGTLALGPLGAVMERNVGAGFETPGEGGCSPICQQFLSQFGEDPQELERWLDVQDLDLLLHTIYRPVSWPPGQRVPIVVWGNGTCMQPEVYGALLHHVASHGFFVVAANNRCVGDGNAQRKALDFAFAANSDPTSPYYQKLDTSKVAAMGHTQGGLGTSAASSDARVGTAILFNGGSTASKPYLAISGDRDIGGSLDSLRSAVMGSSQPKTAWIWYHMVPGTGSVSGLLTLVNQPQRVAPATVAWLRMLLLDDAASRAWFSGSNCMLCGRADQFEFGQKGL